MDETTRVCGAKRLGLKIEAKRLGGKRPGGKRFRGETSCYHGQLVLLIKINHTRQLTGTTSLLLLLLLL